MSGATRAATEAEKRSYEQIAKSLKPLIAIDFADLLAREIPPQEMLLAPFLCSGSISMIYAPRGLGKTYFTLCIAFALATGKRFLKWSAGKPNRVLYIDGEMSAAVMQARCNAIQRMYGVAPARGMFRLITPDLLNRPAPNLVSAEDRALIDELAADADIIIFDNLSCLVRGGAEENSAESAEYIANLALPLRALSKAVIFVHHAGKGGQQRGTSKREDLLDTVIALRKPTDYAAADGARFEVHFEKSRHIHGGEIEPFEAHLTSDANGEMTWVTRSLEGTVEAKILDLMNVPNMSFSDIARELGIHKSTVSRHVHDLRQRGLLQPDAKAQKTKQLRLQQPRNSND